MSDSSVRIEHLASLLGVPTEVVPRVANSHPAGKLTPWQEQNIRAILPDNAEFIVPVFWSQSDFVGFPSDSNSSNVELIAVGEGLIANPVHSEAPERYLKSVVSGVALQAQGVRRQGYFVIGRKSISIVGAFCDFVPYLGPNDLYVYRDSQSQQNALFWQFPPNECAIDLVANIPFSDLDGIDTFELCRFDGLAAFLAALNNTSQTRARVSGRDYYKNLEKRQDKISNDIRKNKHTNGMFHNRVETMIQLQSESPEDVSRYFSDRFQNALSAFSELGLNLASGTGLVESMKRRQCLLNSAIGVALQDSRNGFKYFLESPFSELDLAVSILPNAMSSANEIPEPPTHQVSNSVPDDSFTAEVRKLNDLRNEGLLTDDEFVAAKSALLRKLDK